MKKTFIVLLFLSLVTTSHAFKEGKKFKGKGFKSFDSSRSFNQSQKGNYKLSSLKESFPEGVNCPAIASPFGSPTRYDGSKRPTSAPGGGRHGGIDISLDIGTPLLSLSSGKVIAKGKGGRMLGTYIWLQYSPDDTSLPFWLYAKYQHLDSMSELDIGDVVKTGQTIGYAGKTGTTGGHYGSSGYPHLHLSTWKGEGSDYKVRGSKVMVSGMKNLNTLVLYKKLGLSSGARVNVPYQMDDGEQFLKGTNMVYPVGCKYNN